MYFFESAVSPNIFWVDIKAIDFRKTDIKKLYLGENQENIYSGDVSSSFKKEKAFEFLGVK